MSKRSVSHSLSIIDQLEPGEVGRLLALVSTVGLAALAPGWRVLGVLLLAVVLALLLSHEALRAASKDRSWPMLAVLAVGLGLLTGERDLPLGPLSMSSAGLALGIQMTVRALAILLAVYTVTTGLSLTAVALLFERVGFKGLGFALGVALNTLPMVQTNFRDAVTALRLRGGFRRRRLRAIRLLLLTTITSSVRHAESIVAAAEARGFTVERSVPYHINWRIGDALLLAFLLLVAGAILIR